MCTGTSTIHKKCACAQRVNKYVQYCAASLWHPQVEEEVDLGLSGRLVCMNDKQPFLGKTHVNGTHL